MSDAMSSIMLAASLRAYVPEVRRIRERLLSIASQAEKGLLVRLSDERGAADLYAAMATVRELSRSGEKRIALVQSNMFSNASPALRRAFQQAYDLGSKDARLAVEVGP